MRETSLFQAISRTHKISDQIKEQIPNAIFSPVISKSFAKISVKEFKSRASSFFKIL